MNDGAAGGRHPIGDAAVVDHATQLVRRWSFLRPGAGRK